MTISNHEIVLRWLDTSDHANLLDLLRCCYRSEEWTSECLIKFLQSKARRNTIKVAADSEGTIYGALFYTLGTGTCRIRRLAVWHDYRKRGLGHFLIGNLLKAGSPTPPKVLAFVPPDWDGAHTFFNKTGFHRLDEANEDGRVIYEFQKALLKPQEVS